MSAYCSPFGPVVLLEKLIYIESPTASDLFPIGWTHYPGIVRRVTAETDAGTVDFNITKRLVLSDSFTGGTNIWTSDKQATTSIMTQTTFQSPRVAPDTGFWFDASAIASSPTKIFVTILLEIA